MKHHQFMPFNTSQGDNEYQLEQASPTSDEWSRAGGGPQPDASSAQRPQEASTPQVPHRPAGTGLLSKWKSNQQQLQQLQYDTSVNNPVQQPTSLVEQDTLVQPAIQRSITDPNFNANVAQAFAVSAGPVSPHQSGITAASAMFPNAPIGPTPSQVLQPFGSQGLQPMMGSTPSQALQPLAFQPSRPLRGTTGTLPPLAPATMPGLGQVQPGWQTMGRYPGGPSPFVQGPHQRQDKAKKRHFPIWARVIVGVLLVLLVAGGAGAYYYEVNFAAPVSNIVGQTVKRVHGDDAPSQGRDTNNSNGILSGGRINILLLGSDDDYKSVHIYGGILAQTDIVVSIDPATQSVSMLSIPRDSWLNVPGFGMRKLDQAYLLGGGGANGAALSMATIHQDFGIYIDHYAWVGLSGFVKVIDTVGGVDIDVIHPITDGDYPDDTGKGALDPYAVKRLYIAPGPQHLSGLPALEYVRSRHADLVGDFGRSVRQQQILNQLKYKLDNPNIVGQLPTLAQDLNGSVKTDMQLTDVFKLVYFAKSLDQSKINRVTLGPPYSGTATLNTPAGTQDVVILNCGRVQPLIAKMFALGNNARCDQASSSNGSLTASTLPTSPTASTSNATVQVPTLGVNNSWRTVNEMARVSTMSLTGNNHDFLGIYSLLDLMFLVVFESPAALHI